MNDQSNKPYEFVDTSDHKRKRVPKSALDKFLALNASILFNVVAPLALLALGALAIWFFGEAQAPPRDENSNSLAARMQSLSAVRVKQLQSLEASGQQLQLEVDGVVVPYREAMVAAEIGGRIVDKDPICEAGSVVKKGQVLMKIDPTDYKLEVDRLSREKERAYQALLELDQEMVNAKRLLDVAVKDVELQAKEVERQESLPKDFSSRADIDAAKRAFLQSEQQRVSSQNNLDLLGKRRGSLEKSEQLAATQLKVAELDLARTEIVAPIDGVIVRENADMNSFVNRGTTLVTIEDTSKVEVATNLRMDQLYWVLDQSDSEPSGEEGYHLPETPAHIDYVLSGRDDMRFRWKGRLLSYDGIGLDQQTRTVPVRVVVDRPRDFQSIGVTGRSNGPNALLRGMYVQVKLLIKPKTPLVVVPGEAIQPGNRVWQFVQDESVLEAKKKDTEGAQEVPNDQDNQDQAEPNFDPSTWTAGRVLVQKSVYPVDTLAINEDKSPNDGSVSRLAGKKTFWVCEVRGDEFGADSFVVTSPVNAVDANGLPARAQLNGESLSDGGSKAMASESVSPTDEAHSDGQSDAVKPTPVAARPREDAA